MSFKERVSDYVSRVEATLDCWLPSADEPPARLHEAMRHGVLNGGKRIRPLLVFAVGEVLDIDPGLLDAPAAAVELIHCYSLVHDDLPAMDDDVLRRGRPTVHVAFDEATGVLVGDALQSLAFEGLAAHGAATGARRCALLARAAGSRGMAGGQALDLAFESTRPDRKSLERMFRLKTGALIRAAILLAASVKISESDPRWQNLAVFADRIGLAFQIRDDLLDIEGTSAEIGKPAGSDLAHDKATWPACFGADAARARARELADEAAECLVRLPDDTEPLRYLAGVILHRTF